MSERPLFFSILKHYSMIPTMLFALLLYVIAALISPASLGVKMAPQPQTTEAPGEVVEGSETPQEVVVADRPEELFSFTLMSGADWGLTVGELLVAFGLVLLTIEVVKSTKTNATSSLEHAFSAMTFVLYLVLFLSWSRAGSATFFLLMAMSLIDLITGIFVTVAGARRDFGRGGEEF